MGFFTNFVKMFGASGTYHKEAKLFHGEVSHVMGTKFDLVIHGSEEIVATVLWREVCADLEKYERMLDRFDPSSELSLVNEGKAVPSEELESLIVLSDEYRMKTGGCFDITKGSTERGKVQYDFGGFAKGFVLRLALDKVKQAGAGCVLADFGQSSFFALGGHPLGGSWKASLKSPYSGAVLSSCFLMIYRLRMRPNPLWSPWGLSGLSARKRDSTSSGVIPDPVSETETWTKSPSRRAEMRTEPAWVCCTALLTRLRRRISRRSLSAFTTRSVGAKVLEMMWDYYRNPAVICDDYRDNPVEAYEATII